MFCRWLSRTLVMNLREAFDVPVPTIVLAEGEFGKTGGKTANGVVLHSEVFDAQVVIDSTTAGKSPSEVLGRDDAPAVPIVESMNEALCERVASTIPVVDARDGPGPDRTDRNR